MISKHGEKWEFWRNVLKIEGQNLLMGWMWRMRNSKVTILFWARSYTLNLFTTLASKIVMYQPSGTRSRTDCTVRAKMHQGKLTYFINYRQRNPTEQFSYLGEPLSMAA